MLLLEKTTDIITSNYTPNDHSETCLCDDLTLICGKIIEVDYKNRVESKMVSEPFYGDIDLFGF